MQTERLCLKCHEVKPRGAFHLRDGKWLTSHCKVCRAANAYKYYKANPEYRLRQLKRQQAPKVREQKRLSRRRAPIAHQLWIRARQRAKRDGTTFTINAADIKVSKNCPCCAVDMEMGDVAARPHSPSLDKVINSLGYVPGNVWIICYRCNALKGDSSPQELRAIATAVEGWINGKKETEESREEN